MANEVTIDPQERFLEFFKKEKYRQRIGQMAIQGKESFTVEFEDLFSFDQKLAEALLDKPETFLEHANNAAYAQLGIENAEYAQEIDKVTVRITRLLGHEQLRKLGSKQMGKLVMIEAIVVRATPVRPMVMKAMFKCKRCGTMNEVEQKGQFLKAPTVCAGADCGKDGPFEFVQEESKFIDSQDLRLQERPEDLPPGQLPRTLAAKIIGDEVVDIARPGDHVAIVGIVQAFAPSRPGIGKLRTFILQLDANSVETLGKEPETSPPTPEEEEKIIALSKDPKVHQKLINSIAPSIFGYPHIKEAVLYLLCGGVSRSLPDMTVRGEMNALLIGDPGCLVADERVLLGNGKITKICNLGKEHLQPINIPVKTGHGANQRATATAFHIYRQQPIIEIVTESGKSLKGTYNQPVLKLVTDGQFGSVHISRQWTRLDELKIGDKIAVVKGFTCQLKSYVPTGFRSYEQDQKSQVTLPTKLDPSLAGIFGYVIGNGDIDKDKITLYVNETEKDLTQALVEKIEKCFGLKPEVNEQKTEQQKSTVFNLVICNFNVAYNLSILLEKRVPQIIFDSPNDCVSEFLKWLFEADRTVFDKQTGRQAITLKMKNIELLRDVQLLLLRFGIYSKISGIDTTNPLLTIHQGRDIVKFHQKIGFASLKKRSKLDALTKSVEQLRKGHQKRYEKITKIVRHSPEDVYDIEVPENHSFVANGIIVHNTAKSQLLQYVARIAPRGLYTSGRGTTAAGLTAAVVREKGGSMSLEAGALVLADKGIACLTEDTEIYTGEDLVKIGKLWQDTSGPILKTKTGREAKNVQLPVNIYDRKQRSDREGYAYAIMRKRYVGEIVKISFASGLSLKVTPEHLLKRPTNVKNLWISADQIKVGDKIRAPVSISKSLIKFKIDSNEAYAIGCAHENNDSESSSKTIFQLRKDSIGEIDKKILSTFSGNDKVSTNGQMCNCELITSACSLYVLENSLHKTEPLSKRPSINKILMFEDKALWAFFAGVFDINGNFNNDGTETTLNLHPVKYEHELAVILYALRRLGIYAQIQGKNSTKPVIQITGTDISRFIYGISAYSLKVRTQPQKYTLQHKDKCSNKKGIEKVISIERMPYDGYVYDLSVEKYHNYEAALVYVHNCIDEMDKMRPEDRVAIHEAMEQHTVSVAKGGIVATLNARTSVLAAANPALGRYEPHRTVAENISLPVTILSRFDVIFVLRDVPNRDADSKMSQHLLEIHQKGRSPVEAPVDAELLRKYISYSKTIQPSLSEGALNKLREFYLAMRMASESEGSPVAITARQLDSLVRASEARARSALRKEVTPEDADAAITLMKRSLEEVGIDMSSYKVDIDIIMTGRPKSVRDKLQVVLSAVIDMEKETGTVEKDSLVTMLETKHKMSRSEIERMIGQLLREGTLYEPGEGRLKKT